MGKWTNKRFIYDLERWPIPLIVSTSEETLHTFHSIHLPLANLSWLSDGWIWQDDYISRHNLEFESCFLWKYKYVSLSVDITLKIWLMPSSLVFPKKRKLQKPPNSLAEEASFYSHYLRRQFLSLISFCFLCHPSPVATFTSCFYSSIPPLTSAFPKKGRPQPNLTIGNIWVVTFFHSFPSTLLCDISLLSGLWNI